MSVHFFGVRHHGPGCAHALERALEVLDPDCILIEGPPECDQLLELADDPGMTPPVAMLVYAPQHQGLSSFFPYAVYSPEWRAILFARRRSIECSFIDLPQKHTLAMRLAEREEREERKEREAREAHRDQGSDADEYLDRSQESTSVPQHPETQHAHMIARDPLGYLARLNGEENPEIWWDRAIESQRSDGALFEAIHTAMRALRIHLSNREGEDVRPIDEVEHEARREAHMRKMIRQAQRRHERIAVVCGAWHVPALEEKVKVSADQALLKGLPKLKVEVSWTPWTYGRMTIEGGYGAGVRSPAWYGYLWAQRAGADLAQTWLTDAARALRREGFDLSSAHVIEASRLAEALASLRGEPHPALNELEDSLLSVCTGGHARPLELIRQQLVVGERLGAIPDSGLSHPLILDFHKRAKSLRLKQTLTPVELNLDLRQSFHVQKSSFIRRLRLLEISWGVPKEVTRHPLKGSFHESWMMCWHPEMMMPLIEASALGETVEVAATQSALIKAEDPHATLSDLTTLLHEVLLAQLESAVEVSLYALSAKAAMSREIEQLLTALPPLVQSWRYSETHPRGADPEALMRVIDQLIPRVNAGLLLSCVSVNDEEARARVEQVDRVHSSLLLIGDAHHIDGWYRALMKVSRDQRVHPRLTGRLTRLLIDRGFEDEGSASRALSRALSLAGEPSEISEWLEGFLSGGGLILVHDQPLLSTLDAWVSGLPEDTFIALLPLLRRTFSLFSQAENRMILDATRGLTHSQMSVQLTEGDRDEESADEADAKERAERRARSRAHLKRLDLIEPTLRVLFGDPSKGSTTPPSTPDPTASV